jgi:hypothetical protein
LGYRERQQTLYFLNLNLFNKRIFYDLGYGVKNFLF